MGDQNIFLSILIFISLLQICNSALYWAGGVKNHSYKRNLIIHDRSKNLKTFLKKAADPKNYNEMMKLPDIVRTPIKTRVNDNKENKPKRVFKGYRQNVEEFSKKYKRNGTSRGVKKVKTADLNAKRELLNVKPDFQIVTANATYTKNVKQEKTITSIEVTKKSNVI